MALPYFDNNPAADDCACKGGRRPCGCADHGLGGFLDWIDEGAKLVEAGAEVADDWGVPGAGAIADAAGRIDDAIPDSDKPQRKPSQEKPADDKGTRVEARRAQRRREFETGAFGDNTACHAALRAAEAADKAEGLWEVWTGRLPSGKTLRIELGDLCRKRTGATVVDNCPPRPIELELMGITETAWCRGTDADFAPMITAVRQLELTAEERTRLLAVPIADRPAAFKALVMNRDGGMPWWGWLLIIMAVGTAIGLVAWKLGD